MMSLVLKKGSGDRCGCCCSWAFKLLRSCCVTGSNGDQICVSLQGFGSAQPWPVAMVLLLMQAFQC